MDEVKEQLVSLSDLQSILTKPTLKDSAPHVTFCGSLLSCYQEALLFEKKIRNEVLQSLVAKYLDQVIDFSKVSAEEIQNFISFIEKDWRFPEDIVAESENNKVMQKIKQVLISKVLPAIVYVKENPLQFTGLQEVGQIFLNSEKNDVFCKQLLMCCFHINIYNEPETVGDEDISLPNSQILLLLGDIFKFNLQENTLVELQDFVKKIKEWQFSDALTGEEKKKMEVIKVAMLSFFNGLIASKRLETPIKSLESTVYTSKEDADNREKDPMFTIITEKENNTLIDRPIINCGENVAREITVFLQSELHDYALKLEIKISKADKHSEERKTLEDRQAKIKILQAQLQVKDNKITSKKLDGFARQFDEIKNSDSFKQHVDSDTKRFLYRVTNLLTVGLMHKARTGHWGLWVTKTEGERTLTRIDKKLQAVRLQR